MTGPFCVCVGVGVDGLVGVLVVPAAWAAAGAAALFAVPFWTGVVGRPGLAARACPGVVVCLRDTSGSRTGIHRIQRSSRDISGVLKEFEAMSTRRDWRKEMGFSSVIPAHLGNVDCVAVIEGNYKHL